MKIPQIIAALGALAHEHRLAIFRLLVERGPAGLPAGRIAERVGLVPSSLTFHLQNLQRAGLIAQRRESRQLIYSADFTAMTSLVAYLTENCCAESAAECCPPARQSKAAKRPAKAACNAARHDRRADLQRSFLMYRQLGAQHIGRIAVDSLGPRSVPLL